MNVQDQEKESCDRAVDQWVREDLLQHRERRRFGSPEVLEDEDRDHIVDRHHDRDHDTGERVAFVSEEILRQRDRVQHGVAPEQCLDHDAAPVILADQLRHGEGCQGENNIRGKTYTQQRKYILRVGEFVTHY